MIATYFRNQKLGEIQQTPPCPFSGHQLVRVLLRIDKLFWSISVLIVRIYVAYGNPSCLRNCGAFVMWGISGVVFWYNLYETSHCLISEGLIFRCSKPLFFGSVKYSCQSHPEFCGWALNGTCYIVKTEHQGTDAALTVLCCFFVISRRVPEPSPGQQFSAAIWKATFSIFRKKKERV